MDVPWELLICRVVPFWYAGRVLWSECKNPIRPKTPIDQSYVPTSWVFVVHDSKYFCGLAMWILDLCFCYTSVSAVLVLCPPRVSIVCMILVVCYFFLILCIWSFVLSGLGICVLCVKLLSAGPIKGRLDFFFFFWEKCTMRLYDEWTMS